MSEEKYEGLLPRFLRCVRTETRSNLDSKAIPSDPRETVFLSELKDESISLGLNDVHINPQSSCLVATIPSNIDKDALTVGFTARIDTADFSIHNVNLQIVKDHDGRSDIKLDKDGQYALTATEFPSLERYQGNTLITIDRSTLLGTDDRLGVAEIVVMAAYLMAHPEVKHGTTKISLGPDEEIGIGTDHFDARDSGADFAYTVDNGPLGELEYETFSVAQVEVKIQGKDVHIGVTKGAMVNTIQVTADLQNSSPVHGQAERTDG